MNCLIKSFMTWVLREVWKFWKIVIFSNYYISFDPILAGWKTRKTLFVDKILNIWFLDFFELNICLVCLLCKDPPLEAMLGCFAAVRKSCIFDNKEVWSKSKRFCRLVNSEKIWSNLWYKWSVSRDQLRTGRALLRRKEKYRSSFNYKNTNRFSHINSSLKTHSHLRLHIFEWVKYCLFCLAPSVSILRAVWSLTLSISQYWGKNLKCQTMSDWAQPGSGCVQVQYEACSTHLISKTLQFPGAFRTHAVEQFKIKSLNIQKPKHVRH